MTKSIKLKNNMYLDTKGIIHNKRELNTVIDNVNSSIIDKTSNALAVTARTDEITLINFDITEPGKYLIFSKVPVNYYGAEGRELFLYLKLNNIIEDIAGGVLNNYIWTHYETLFAICNVPANSNIKLTVKNNGAGKQFAIGGFSLRCMKLKGE